jgi:hypothetical protein
MSKPGHRIPLAESPTARKTTALLCLAVAIVNMIDNGGVGSQTPTYLAVGYYLVEIGAAVAAALLMASPTRAGWLLSAAAALGPLASYILSRGPGLPAYSADKGNWGEPLGMLSVVLEGAVLTVAVPALGRTALTGTAFGLRRTPVDAGKAENEPSQQA